MVYSDFLDWLDYEGGSPESASILGF